LVSLQHTSAASRVLISDGGQPIGPVPLRRFDRPYGFHHCAVSTIGTEQLELADVRGGSFDGISSHRDDARPVVFDSAVQVSAVQPLWNAHAHDRSNHMSSAAVLFVPSTIAGHAPTRSSCVVFRYAAIGLPQPCRAMPIPPSFEFLAQRRSWDSTLRRFAPADGWRAAFLPIRAHVSFRTPMYVRPDLFSSR